MRRDDSAQNAALMEHRIKGRAMVPGAAGVAMMVAAARTLAAARGSDNTQLAHVVFHKPVFLDLPSAAAAVAAAPPAAAAAVCCTVAVDGTVAVADYAAAGAPPRAATSAMTGRTAHCGAVSLPPAPQRPPAAGPVAGAGAKAAGMSSALLSLLRAMNHWPSASDDRGSAAASLPPSLAAARITHGAAARDCHPSDVHLCPRMVDAAMHSGAAAQGTVGRCRLTALGFSACSYITINCF